MNELPRETDLRAERDRLKRKLERLQEFVNSTPYNREINTLMRKLDESDRNIIRLANQCDAAEHRYNVASARSADLMSQLSDYKMEIYTLIEAQTRWKLDSLGHLVTDKHGEYINVVDLLLRII